MHSSVSSGCVIEGAQHGDVTKHVDREITSSAIAAAISLSDVGTRASRASGTVRKIAVFRGQE